MKNNKLAPYIQTALKKEPRILACYVFCSLTGLGSLGRKVHKCDNYSQKTKVQKKKCPKYCNIINSHLISLNRFIPILKNTTEIVNPNSTKRSWGNPILELNRPNIQEARDNLETSRQNLAISSFWRFVINKISLVQIYR